MEREEKKFVGRSIVSEDYLRFNTMWGTHEFTNF